MSEGALSTSSTIRFSVPMFNHHFKLQTSVTMIALTTALLKRTFCHQFDLSFTSWPICKLFVVDLFLLIKITTNRPQFESPTWWKNTLSDLKCYFWSQSWTDHNGQCARYNRHTEDWLNPQRRLESGRPHPLTAPHCSHRKFWPPPGSTQSSGRRCSTAAPVWPLTLGFPFRSPAYWPPDDSRPSPRRWPSWSTDLLIGRPWSVWSWVCRRQKGNFLKKRWTRRECSSAGHGRRPPCRTRRWRASAFESWIKNFDKLIIW